MKEERSSDEETTVMKNGHTTTNSGLKLLYEVDNDLGRLVPHLRLIVDEDVDVDTVVSEAHATKTRILTPGL